MQGTYSKVLKRLIAYRRRVKKSQVQMSEEIGLTQSHYSKIERGAKTITNDVLLKLHEMGVDIDHLITGVDSKGTILNELLEQCPPENRVDFMNIVISYINMMMSNNENNLYCKNELELLKFNLDKKNDKKNSKNVETVWKCIRKTHNLTQEKMADILDVNIKSYRAIEKGNSMPNVMILTNLYDKLGYFPTLVEDLDSNYLLMANRLWKLLSGKERATLEKIIKYNLDYIIENINK